MGEGALALHDIRHLLDRQRQAAALSFEGLGGNPLILSPAIQKGKAVRRPCALRLDPLFEMTAAL
nr:hypothetical protein [Rhizobium bangladeshense]